MIYTYVGTLSDFSRLAKDFKNILKKEITIVSDNVLLLNIFISVCGTY